MAKLDPESGPKTLAELQLLQMNTKTPTDDGLVVLASTSHMTEQTTQLISQYRVGNLKNIGSSLKFCMLARGDGDLYPRAGPTMEWDTAAGQAILQAAGGQVLCLDGSPLFYGPWPTGIYRSIFDEKSAMSPSILSSASHLITERIFYSFPHECPSFYPDLQSFRKSGR